jgi:hypothetical protein
MSQEKKRPYVQTIIFGVISLTSYIILFSNEGWVTDTYTKGGYYAAYPIITAFWFSFMHGAFGSNLLTVLGLEAKKSKSK